MELLIFGNDTAESDHLISISFISIFIAVIPSLITVATIVGNAIILHTILYKTRNLTKLLIANLALADLLVGIIIMPFAVSNIVMGSNWIYGQTICKIWCSMDVICCTASIFTLCAISGDRFIGITRPFQYTQIVTRCRVAWICATIWLISIFVLAATFRWSTVRDEMSYACNVGNQLQYAAESTIVSFFLPFGIICILYYQIFQVASRSSKSFTRIVRKFFSSANKDQRTNSLASIRVHYGSATQHAERGQTLALRKQQKTAKILTLIVGAFIFCWMPFFILHLLSSLTQTVIVPNYVMDIFTWLGYFNSLLNPLIYGTRMQSFKSRSRLGTFGTEANSIVKTYQLRENRRLGNTEVRTYQPATASDRYESRRSVEASLKSTQSVTQSNLRNCACVSNHLSIVAYQDGTESFYCVKCVLHDLARTSQCTNL